jgi:hypothetical protein
MTASNRDVRGYSKSGQAWVRSDCPLSANSRHRTIFDRYLLTQKANRARIPSRKLRLACRSSFSTHPGRMRFRFVHSVVFITEVAKNKQADRRGQIALFARNVDLGNQFRQRHLPVMRDFFQVSPEGIFKADAGLVPIDDDGPFDDRGFH